VGTGAGFLVVDGGVAGACMMRNLVVSWLLGGGHAW